MKNKSNSILPVFMSFVHLHTHSHYSLLDGLSKIDELIALAKDFGMPGFALTDHGVMYGIIEFYQKAKKAGLHPIIGVEAYVAPNKHTDKRPKIDERPYHLLMLAKDYEGYTNLMKLTTKAHLDGFYYKPRIDHDLLERHSKGIICASACLAGEISRNILSGNYDEAAKIALWHQKVFGKGNYYLEVQHHPKITEQERANEGIYRLSKELGIPLIATNDSHYPKSDDALAQDVLLCIQTKKTLDDTDRMSYMEEDFSFKSQDAMKEAFSEHPQAISNTVEILEKCGVDIEFGKIQLPSFDVPKGKTDHEYLTDICKEGLKERYKSTDVSKEINERLEYELSVIEKTGYSSYFLIVSDFIRWAKDNKIVVGPGRGSAAGSMVAYLTKITDIDPIKYELLFERFLNPERVSMPDIDTDFADTRRDEVLRHVTEKYGGDHVAQIITFGTMAARASIRDVGRVLGLPYAYCDRVAKLIPMFTSLKEAIDTVPELKEVINDPDGKRLIEIAQRVEGCARHASTHACGVVITKNPLDEYTPRQKGTTNDDSIMTQYEMHAIEDLGLLKMDFLGLKNLTIIEKTLEILKKARGIEIDMEHVPLDDKKTFQLLQRGETTGVFQLESSGMKRYLKMLKPTEFEDIIAMVALYRPGPMEFIPHYIDGKHKKRQITYLDSKLEPILGKTYGIALYQEQIMQIARSLAGFSYAQADVLRKAVGKKIESLLKEQEKKMIEGMIANNISPKVARLIWDFILPFARYGLNRSHAACYAMIAYRTAYLKAHYPAEFMASLLTSDQHNIDRIAIEISECSSMGLMVLPPDINESFSTFTVVYDTLDVVKSKTSKTVRFGMNAVKNLGENIVKEIIRERKENGPYTNLEDFLSRIKIRDLNKKSLEALIKSGALDAFGDRGKLYRNVDKMLSFIRNVHEEANSNQSSLFGMLAQTSTLPRLVMDNSNDISDRDRLSWEKEYLGLYLSSHPLKEIESILMNSNIPSLHDVNNHQSAYRDSYIKVAGVITSIKRIVTKKGEVMLFVKIEDVSGNAEVLVFPSVLQENPDIWLEDTVVLVFGRLSDKDGEPKVLCESVRAISPENINDVLYEFSQLKGRKNGRFRSEKSKLAKNGGSAVGKISPAREIVGSINISVPKTMDARTAQRLKELFMNYPGSFKVYLQVQNGSGAAKTIVTSYLVSNESGMIREIQELFGENCVRLEEKRTFA